MPTPSNWQSLGADNLYGGAPVGQGSAMPIARSELEAIRMGTGRVPQAEYPDGYLGTIRSRRDDRLLDSMKTRVTQRNYQRGVHKGERIDPSDYIYPQALSPVRGLIRQMQARRNPDNTLAVQRNTLLEEFAPPPHLINDGKADMVADQPMLVDQIRQEKLARLRPPWSV